MNGWTSTYGHLQRDQRCKRKVDLVQGLAIPSHWDHHIWEGGMMDQAGPGRETYLVDALKSHLGADVVYILQGRDSTKTHATGIKEGQTDWPEGGGREEERWKGHGKSKKKEFCTRRAMLGARVGEGGA